VNFSNDNNGFWVSWPEARTSNWARSLSQANDEKPFKRSMWMNCTCSRPKRPSALRSSLSFIIIASSQQARVPVKPIGIQRVPAVDCESKTAVLGLHHSPSRHLHPRAARGPMNI
jgi:hypothetical protein